MRPLIEELDHLLSTAWLNDVNGRDPCDILYPELKEFCSKWKVYAPNLCQWLMSNALTEAFNYVVTDSGLDVCKELFATEIQKADRLFSKDQRKKEIRESSIAFHI
mgnify:CR=1 FL=1